MMIPTDVVASLVLISAALTAASPAIVPVTTSTGQLIEVKNANQPRAINTTALEAFLYECMVNFTIMMVTGIPSMNIPSFDPWMADGQFPYEVTDSDLALRVSGSAASVESVGFSSVQTPSLNLNTSAATYNVSFFVPSLEILGDYTAAGSYLFFIPIFGSGPFQVTLYDVTGYGTATLNFDATLTLTMTVSEPLAYRSLAAFFTNLAGISNESHRERITLLLARHIYDQVQEEFRAQFSQALTDYFNDELQSFPSKMSKV